MANLYFNPWDEEYKVPFGANKINSTNKFNIIVETDSPVDVDFVLRSEDGFEKYFPMNPSNTTKYLHTIELTDFDKIGVYSYFFQIREHKNDCTYLFFYGAKRPHTGEGQCYPHKNETSPFTLTIFDGEDKGPDWYRDAVFYQIFPDSYAKSDNEKIENPIDNVLFYGKTTDRPFYVKEPSGDIARWTYYGGTLRGIREKIPYLKDLGITALYLNPIFSASSVHRYDTADYMEIDPLLGTEKDFTDLIKELHKNNMQIVLDGVFSHVGRNSTYFNYDGRFGENVGAYRDPKSPHIDWFKFKEYPHDYESWWGIMDLPEIDKHNPVFQNYIYQADDSVVNKWTKFGVDGWRLDVADELPDSFIAGIRKTLNNYNDKVLIGEVWEDASRKIAYEEKRKYILGNSMHSVMNYPFRSLILDFLNKDISAQTAYYQLTNLQENYPFDIFLNNFNNIGTHDTARALTMLGEDTNKLYLALQMLMTLPGVPCIYYGDEALTSGGPDPDNRSFFPWENINDKVHDDFKKWIRIRKENKELSNGLLLSFYTNKSFGIIRYNNEKISVHVINASNSIDILNDQSIHFSKPIPDRILSLFSGVKIEPQSSILLSKNVI
ncbi:hypothetical protein BG262_01560 [Floricoccus penangensis]|uniref:Glycosyl hydrolase family 13 catalytic domain-containing protein n=1 Tax=Floricoccus penangensis TaxID=1859475 RepID=A0A9Q5NZZ4_9LACT|nr:glycoside hydrolase family 13 protein [Floricoccus penangensis]OFI47043.1 hypothetical protein BG262_01560 [Floricoccus penangensis]